MIAGATLLAYAVVLLMAAAPALAQARWPERAPRLAVAAWFAVTVSAVTSVILGALAPLLPHLQVNGNSARMLVACLTALMAKPRDAALAFGGAALALTVLIRVAWCTAGTLVAASLARRRHRQRLQLAGQADARLGAVVVGHDQPAAYCLAGRGQPIVFTSAAIRALGETQIAAVMAHEQAHQRGHHHLLVALAESLAAAFPRIAALRRASEQVARLVELRADDAAAAACHRLEVAEALLAIAAPAPAAALGAGGTATAARIRRLIADPAPIGRAAATGGIAAITGLAVIPLALAAALTAAGSNCEHAYPIDSAGHPGWVVVTTHGRSD
jgi:Zn-dependent protease with chaperone function